MPLEAIAFTPEQQQKFEEAGGLINPPPEIATAFKHQENMLYWTKSFVGLREEIDGKIYGGFNLFKKVYKAFPDIRSMTKEEATEV